MAADVRNVWSNVATLATLDVTPPGVITDSSGGTDPGDNIIAAVTGDDTVKHAIAQLAAKINITRTAIIALEAGINALKDSFILKG